MKVEINIDPAFSEPKIVVCTNAVTPDITALVETLSASPPASLFGWHESEAIILPLDDIFRIYTVGQCVCADTANGAFKLNKRIYELEQSLAGSPLIRISQSEIVNFKHVKSLDLSTAGTIVLSFKNGMLSYVSRRYIAKIRMYLGL